MNIILLAPPAAGKGTQAELLVEKYHLNHISTGNLFREVASRKDEFGNKIKEILSSGNLISDDIVLDIFRNYLETCENKNLLLDGFPRTWNQAELFDQLLQEKADKIDFVFLLQVSKETLKTRITGRRLCKECGSSYNVNIDSFKPKKDSICDKCGQELYQRADDNEESFEVRYNEYLTKTSPLIDYYREKKVLYEIDSEKSKEEVFADITSIIEKR